MNTSPVEPAAPACGHVLIADDEESVRWVLQRACEADGHSVDTVATGAAAIAALRTTLPDVALIDIRLPDVSGLDALLQARSEGVDTPIIIITAQNTMVNAVEATKRGAYDYLTKPFDVDDVRRLVRHAINLRRMTREIQQLRGELRTRHELVVGKTPAMQEVYKIIGRVAPTDATTLIQGETGTGKELIARAIHYHSGRSGAFVGVNCSAIPHDLLESELFGAERGAFTGAIERRIGKFETPGGTIFLDEVADMPLDLQAKLLRVLQEREFTRIGGREPIRLEARIIAATNQNLEAAVQAHRFREDLFFRLRVVPITVPPLRERRSDIAELIDFFIAKINRDLRTQIVGITAEARDALVQYNWPGNVRELENTLMRTAVLARGRTLTLEDLPPLGSTTAGVREDSDLPLEHAVRRRLRDCLRQAQGRPLRDLHASIIAAVERPLLEFVLQETGGNQLRAAEILGLNRNTLRKRIVELGLTAKPGPKTDSSAP